MSPSYISDELESKWTKRLDAAGDLLIDFLSDDDDDDDDDDAGREM